MTRKPIPVKRLRWMADKLSTMVWEFEQHYPGALQELVNGRSDSMTETMRNVATASAEIDGWVEARTQGLRADPWPGALTLKPTGASQ